MPLTDTTIRNAKPGPKPRRLADGRGLTLSIQPNSTKAWRLRYRFRGKEQQLSLGIYPDVSLQDARRRRDEARQLLARGVNPSTARKATQSGTAHGTADTFETVAREWYASKLPNWKPRTRRMNLMRLERHIFPKIGTQSITDISVPDLLAMLQPLQEREQPVTAHRVLTLCQQVFGYAIATGRITHNIAATVRPALTKSTPTPFAAVTNPRELGPLLRKLHAYDGSPAVMGALKLMALVFVRPGELRQARWADIDLDAAEWRFRVSKTQTDLIVPLATQAVDILRALWTQTGHQSWVFPGARNNERAMSENTLAVAMRTMDIPKEQMSVHGCRAVARTCLDEQLGFPPHLIEHQLGHAVHDPLGRSYNRTTHLPQRRDMMQRWADYLDELRSETTT